MKKLAIVTTHPIQYYAPIFRLLTNEGRINVKVFYTYEKVDEVFDAGFGKSFSWDIPLLEGYDYTYVSNNGNTAKGYKDVTNPTLNKEIEQWGATAILVFGWNYKSHLKALRYFKGKVPVIFRGDSTLLDETTGLKKILRKLFLTWVYRHIDIALYVGKANKEYYQYCGLKESQLVFAPHAIDNNRFAEITDMQQDFVEQTHQQFNIKRDDIVFVFAAKFQSKKNPKLLIEVFKQLAKSNTHLIMVGNGELEQELRELANGCLNIHFLPFQNQSLMPAVYRLGQVFCLPSSGPGETWGLAVNEAMACGRAIIVSDKCGCADDLVDSSNGYVFQSGSLSSLTEAIKSVFENRHAIQSFGQNSFSKIQLWSFENITKAINNI